MSNSDFSKTYHKHAARSEAHEFSNAKVVVIGGGTGSFTLLSGLKHYTHNITALVNMADDGGSTGQLRDELGSLPPGDVRQCLVALSDSPKVRDLFSYRFADGALKGHAFGNLFLSALEKMTGSFAEAVELASDVLKITGQVEPITLQDVKLGLTTKDGKKVVGEFQIAHLEFGSNRPDLWLTPEAPINEAAAKAIEEADLIVIAPGNLYGSLAPALLVKGMRKALSESKAKKAYVCNLVTKPGQTDGFGVDEYIEEIERFAGTQFIDAALYNSSHPTENLLEKYAKQGEFPVKDLGKGKQGRHYEVIAADLIADEIWQNTNTSDKIAAARTLIRHDPDKVAKQLMKFYES